MPTFKHPCPYCATFIERDVVACPACGRKDPFAPRRCDSCRAPITDAAWVACPKCGASLAVVPAASTAPVATPAPAPAAAPIAGACPTCGSSVAAGARFCAVCGGALAG